MRRTLGEVLCPWRWEKFGNRGRGREGWLTGGGLPGPNRQRGREIQRGRHPRSCGAESEPRPRRRSPDLPPRARSRGARWRGGGRGPLPRLAPLLPCFGGDGARAGLGARRARRGREEGFHGGFCVAPERISGGGGDPAAAVLCCCGKTRAAPLFYLEDPEPSRPPRDGFAPSARA
jgi:hypothetical protein